MRFMLIRKGAENTERGDPPGPGLLEALTGAGLHLNGPRPPRLMNRK